MLDNKLENYRKQDKYLKIGETLKLVINGKFNEYELYYDEREMEAFISGLKSLATIEDYTGEPMNIVFGQDNPTSKLIELFPNLSDVDDVLFSYQNNQRENDNVMINVKKLIYWPFICKSGLINPGRIDLEAFYKYLVSVNLDYDPQWDEYVHYIDYCVSSNSSRTNYDPFLDKHEIIRKYLGLFSFVQVSSENSRIDKEFIRAYHNSLVLNALGLSIKKDKDNNDILFVKKQH